MTNNTKGDSTSWMQRQGFVLSLPDNWWETWTADCDNCDAQWYLSDDLTARFSFREEQTQDVGVYAGHCPECGQALTLDWWPHELPPVETIYRRRKR
jgi:hypothetical protein